MARLVPCKPLILLELRPRLLLWDRNNRSTKPGIAGDRPRLRSRLALDKLNENGRGGNRASAVAIAQAVKRLNALRRLLAMNRDVRGDTLKKVQLAHMDPGSSPG